MKSGLRKGGWLQRHNPYETHGRGATRTERLRGWQDLGARFVKSVRPDEHRTPKRRERGAESHWRAITAKREEQIGCETFLLV